MPLEPQAPRLLPLGAHSLQDCHTGVHTKGPGCRELVFGAYVPQENKVGGITGKESTDCTVFGGYEEILRLIGVSTSHRRQSSKEVLKVLNELDFTSLSMTRPKVYDSSKQVVGKKYREQDL